MIIPRHFTPGTGVGESNRAMFPKPADFGRKFEKHRF